MAYFKNLKRFRVNAGLSQNELARKSGIGRDLISKAEKGGDCTPAKLNTLLNTLNALHFGETDHPLDPNECITDA